MPFKSEAQRRLFYAKAKRGEMSKATVKRWEDETPKKKLPERLHKNAQLGDTMDRQLNGAVAAVSKLGLTKEAVMNELRTLQRLHTPLLPRISGRALQPGQLVPRAGGEIGVYGGPAVTDALEASLQNARRRYGTKAPKALADYERLVTLMRGTKELTPNAQPIREISARTGGQETRVLPDRRIELGAASPAEAMLAAQEAASGRAPVLDALTGGAMGTARGYASPQLADLLMLEEVGHRNPGFSADFLSNQRFPGFTKAQRLFHRASSSPNPTVAEYAKRRIQDNPSLAIPDASNRSSVAQQRAHALRSLALSDRDGPVRDSVRRDVLQNHLANLDSNLRPSFYSGPYALDPEARKSLVQGFEDRIGRMLPHNIRTQYGFKDHNFTGGL